MDEIDVNNLAMMLVPASCVSTRSCVWSTSGRVPQLFDFDAFDLLTRMRARKNRGLSRYCFVLLLWWQHENMDPVPLLQLLTA